jgi:hypothetical protein
MGAYFRLPEPELRLIDCASTPGVLAGIRQLDTDTAHQLADHLIDEAGDPLLPVQKRERRLVFAIVARSHAMGEKDPEATLKFVDRASLHRN